MPILAALVGAIFTGVFWWILMGNGREVINAWLDSRNEKARQDRDTASALRARALEASAPLRSMDDPREHATALMVALAGLRGELTPEQSEAIRHQMRRVLDLGDAVDQSLALAQHAVQRIGSADEVMTESLPVFREKLTETERDDLLEMLRAVAAVHGGPTERQAVLIGKLENRFAAERRPRKA